MVSMTGAMWKPPPDRSRNKTEQRKLDWTGSGWQGQWSLKIIWSFEHLQKLQRIRKSRTNLFIPFPEQIANLHFLHFEWMILLTNESDFFLILQRHQIVAQQKMSCLNFQTQWSLSHPPFVWSKSLFHYIKQREQREQQPQFKIPSLVLFKEYIKSFHSECQRTIHHPSKLSRWKQKLEI